MKKNKEKKKINILKIIGLTIKTAVIVLMGMFALIICLQRFSDNSLSVFNYRLFSVASGSMAPKYVVGDVILCKKVDLKTLKVGDDITYLGKSGTFKDKIVTHRVLKIEEADGKLQFHTKGIASTRIDPIVQEEQIYGKIVMEFKMLSWLYKFIVTPSGFYICIFIPLAILLGSEIVSTTVEKYEEKLTKKR
jgi:signal peptidase